MGKVLIGIMLGALGIATIAAGFELMWLFVLSVLLSGGCGLYLGFHLERQLGKDKGGML